VEQSLAPADSFSHKRHRRLTCITCHTTTSPTRTLTFEQPRGCQICHHQRPATSRCATCHQDSELTEPEPVSVTVAVGHEPPRSHEVAFDHEKHADRACVACHTTKVTLEPAGPAATCTACHDDHHKVRRDCAGCHRTAEIIHAHAPPVDAHQACDRCHAERTVGRLEPTRSFCLACHDRETDHYAPQECTVCHLQSSPDSFRVKLTSVGGR